MADLRTNYSPISPAGDLPHGDVNDAFGRINALKAKVDGLPASAATPAEVANAINAAVAAALASKALRTDLNATSAMVAALRDTPVGSGMTVALQAPGTSSANATSSVTGTWFTPDWAASTFYPAGAQVLKLSDGLTVLRRTTAGTSRSTYDATEAALWTELPQGALVTYPMRYNTAFIRRRNLGSNVYGHRGPKYPDGTQEADYTSSPSTIDFDWVTTAGALEVSVYDQTAVRFVIDGQYASAAQTQFTGTADYKWRNVKLSGVPAGYHRVRIEVGSGFSSMSGVKIATADRVYPPSIPNTKRLALIGDSYAEGLTDDNPGNVIIDGYATKLAQALGFTDFANLSKGGTGFTAPSTKLYGPRIDDCVLLAPDYLLIVGTINDHLVINTTLPAAAQALYLDALTRLPNTKIIAIGPPSLNTNLVDEMASMNVVLKTAWVAAGGDPAMFVDTTGYGNVPAAWIATGHPSATGHKYLASRLSTEVASRLNLPIYAPALPAPAAPVTPPAAANVIANGDFATNTVWQGVGYSGKTISGGKLNMVSTPAYDGFWQSSITLVGGKYYELTYTISGLTTGNLYPYICTSSLTGAVTGGIRTANGTYTERILANPGTDMLVFESSGVQTLSVDDVTLVGPYDTATVGGA